MDLVPGRMGQHVKVGASVPKGLVGCKALSELKLGNIMLTELSLDMGEALDVANFCRENGIYFIFSEVVWRGIPQVCRWAAREKLARDEFYTKSQLEDIGRAGGEYYLGRLTIGEAGGILYWPKRYLDGPGLGAYSALPPVETVDEAKRVYLEELRKLLRFEREEVGAGPLWNVDASCVFKYHLEAGIDFPLLEAMPGDFTFMVAAIRGAGKACGKPWGLHIAMGWYGGVRPDAMWLKRWKISLYASFMAGADFVYPETGHFSYAQSGEEYSFSSPETAEARGVLREFNQFAQIHSRPLGGPKVKLGFVYGNLDGYPGLWNKHVWGQFGDDKWLFGPAEYGWAYLDDIYHKGRWDDENIQGSLDFTGSPPYGQYDVVPIESPLSVLKTYSCLVFLGWNTMTSEIYEKLKAYVEAGGGKCQAL